MTTMNDYLDAEQRDRLDDLRAARGRRLSDADLERLRVDPCTVLRYTDLLNQQVIGAEASWRFRVTKLPNKGI